MTQIKEINDGIKQAIEKVKSLKTPGYKLQTTDYAIALALEFPKLMNQKQCFRNIKFGGCFIHPSRAAIMVNKGKTPYQSCKLGDLLVLVRKHSNKHVRYNAALLKMIQSNANPVIITDATNQATLFLYSQWPTFTLGPGGAQYDIYPKTVSQGAMYCIIKNRIQQTQFYITEPMQQMMIDSQMTFARFIRDSINWQTGRAISLEKDRNSDEWSKLIWDLIRQAASSSLYRNIINYHSPSNLSDNFLHMMVEENGIDASGPMIDNFPNEESDAGIPILFIDIEESESEGD